jgi:hypothetical protein
MSNEFADKVRSWIHLDNEIKKHNENLKQLRINKNSVTHDICSYMETNTLTNKTITINNGTLKYAMKKEYSPLTFNYVEECLKKVIDNEDNVKYIIQYLKDNRETRNVPDIRRNDIK